MIIDIKEQINKSIKKYATTAIELNDCLALEPEISEMEFKSSQRIVTILEHHGFKVQYPFAGFKTAFCATLQHGEGANVAILVEYDALPEIGHACGHNVSGSMSVLAALAITDLKEHFKGTLCVIGTPAEESIGSKIRMSADGVFDNFDVAMMIHSSSGNINCANFPLLALKRVGFVFKGQTAHAAFEPWNGKNALTAARKFLDLVDARREAFTQDIRFSAAINSDGRAINVIPDNAEVVAEIRSDSSAKLNQVYEAIIRCAKGAAMALDCNLTYKVLEEDFADMIMNDQLQNEVVSILNDLNIKVTPILPPMGSSDMGNVSYRCPAIQSTLSISDDPVTLHSINFAQATTTKKAHETIENGAHLLVNLALKIWNDSDFRAKVHEEHKHRLLK